MKAVVRWSNKCWGSYGLGEVEFNDEKHGKCLEWLHAEDEVSCCSGMKITNDPAFTLLALVWEPRVVINIAVTEDNDFREGCEVWNPFILEEL